MAFSAREEIARDNGSRRNEQAGSDKADLTVLMAFQWNDKWRQGLEFNPSCTGHRWLPGIWFVLGSQTNCLLICQSQSAANSNSTLPSPDKSSLTLTIVSLHPSAHVSGGDPRGTSLVSSLTEGYLCPQGLSLPLVNLMFGISYF